MDGITKALTILAILWILIEIGLTIVVVFIIVYFFLNGFG